MPSIDLGIEPPHKSMVEGASEASGPELSRGKPKANLTEPRNWKVHRFADVGSSEPFMARIAIGLPEILGVTSFRNRDEIQEVIVDLAFQCLTPAFMSLRELRKIASDDKIPLLQKTKHFDDMCKTLWSAYKDRMQTAAKLMGFDVGFLFQSNAIFNQGCARFLQANPVIGPHLIALMKYNRDTWQTGLMVFRNDYLEHQKLKSTEVQAYYSLERAETLFENVWIGIEEILVYLMSTALPKMVGLREIPESERSPDLPKRFGWSYSDQP